MEAPFGHIAPLLHTAPYLPSQRRRRDDDDYHGDLHTYSSAAPIPPSQAPFVPSGLTAEPATYNRWSTLPSFPYSNYIPYGEGSCSEVKSGSASPLYMNGQRVPTTGPGPYSSYQAQSVLAYQSSNPGYMEPQQSCPPPHTYTSPPPPMQGYGLYQQMGPLPRLPDLAPMPAGGLNENSSLPSARRRRQNIAAAVQSKREPQPSLVVGSQGRRGILPSDIGCPAAISGQIATGQRSANVPVKDEFGKFPCPHCNKTYLHAKHLKRHLLRHTGIRPYSCGLCSETFSRSDILKRHFEKCSTRRGNPTGANHLTHSRAAKQSNLEAAEKARQVETVVRQRTRSLPSGPTTMVGDFVTSNCPGSYDFNAPVLVSPVYLEERQPVPHRESRSSSVKRPSTSGMGVNVGNVGNVSNVSNVSNVGAPNPSGYDPTGFAISGQVTPDSITTSGAATPYQYPHELRSNQFPLDASFTQGVPVSGAQLLRGHEAGLMQNGMGASLPHIIGSSHDRENEFGWDPLLPLHGQDELAYPQYHAASDSALHSIKPERDFSQAPIAAPLQFRL